MTTRGRGDSNPARREGPPPRGPVHRHTKDAAWYWRANLRLIAVLLSVWAFVSFGCSIFGVEWLNRFRLGGLPLGFWFGQQGAIYVFVVLIFGYAWCMDRIDRRYGVDE